MSKKMGNIAFNCMFNLSIIFHELGTISYKLDVYSYGMLVLEMVNRMRNLDDGSLG